MSEAAHQDLDDRRARRWARMDADFRRSLGDFDLLLRGKFKRRLPEVEALPPLIRAACRVLEAGRSKPFTEFVADPSEPMADALARFATDSAVRLRPVKLEGDWARDLQNPLLVLLRRDGRARPSPAPLLKDWRRRLYLEFPEDGGRRIPFTRELQARLEPIGYAFHATLPGGKLTYRDVLLFALRHSYGALAEIAAWGTLSALFSLATPLALGLVVGVVIPTRDVTLLVAILAGLLLTWITLGSMRLAAAIAQVRLDGRLGQLIHAAMIDRLLRLPAAAWRSQTSLILATQLETVEKFRRGVTHQVIHGGLAFMHLVVLASFLVFYNTPAGLLAIGLSAVLIALAVVIGRRQFEVIYEGERMDVIVLAFVYDLIRLFPVLRAMGAEQLGFTQWAQNFLAFQSRLDRSARIYNIAGIFEAGWETAVYIAVFAAVALSIDAQAAGLTTAAVAVAFIVGLEKLVRAARQTAHAVTSGAKLLPLAKLARSFIEHRLETPGGRVPVGTLSGAIEVVGLGFTYGSSIVLSDVSFQIPAGGFVGIVGTSGAGKSTLMRLLLGLEEPHSGGIYLDGRNMASLDPRLVRRQIGTVMQHSRLFPGTLFENVRGATAIGLDDVWQALELAGIADELRALPMGVHTLVGEDGAGFSGGQVQRLLLARALASRPKVLVLDEPTSALDGEAQARVVETLKGLQATRVMVAHRFAALLHCDEIIVLDGGRIADRGSFAELAAREGLFRDLLQRQTAQIGAWRGLPVETMEAAQ